VEREKKKVWKKNVVCVCVKEKEKRGRGREKVKGEKEGLKK
jgi:hypothetical protein